MKHKLFVVFASLLSIGLLGCNVDFTSAKGVVKTAFYAVDEQDMELFLSTLDGKAKEDYGNEAGMAYFDEIAGMFDEFKYRVGDYKEDPISNDEKVRTYNVSVNGVQPGVEYPLWNLTVDCNMKRTLDNTGRPCVPQYDGGQFCRPGTGDNAPVFRVIVDCKIMTIDNVE